MTFEDLCHGKKSKRPNKAKSLVAQPLFRSRREQGEERQAGSYRREASVTGEASFVMAA
ncbi:ribosome alternative rescue factor ArfA [Pseudomonas aeruginosa]|nr:ribosome alternative rescue factor ArfA [Pseudomonas aeruginosa]